ncbi:MAG TPA: STAS domain-containing protein [Mycobacteriales bacterium]|nr:STAS domain-containing protein [Mycobacteriales bacterium]
MWWRHRHGRHSDGAAALVAEPGAVVLHVTDALTAATAEGLAGQVDRIGSETPVVIDLTAIPSFDSDGAATLSGLQERRRPQQVTIVGLRQATARLTGVTPAGTGATTAHGWSVRRLRNLAVIQAGGELPVTADTLEAPLAEAVDQDVAIVVCDLRGVSLTDAGSASLAFASSAAALRGQELLVVNVAADDVERLRRIGLSATTYVASET